MEFGFNESVFCSRQRRVPSVRVQDEVTEPRSAGRVEVSWMNGGSLKPGVAMQSVDGKLMSLYLLLYSARLLHMPASEKSCVNLSTITTVGPMLV